MSDSIHSRLNRLFHASVIGNVFLLAAVVILYIIRQTLRDQPLPHITPTPRVDALTDNAGQICLHCDFQGQQSDDTLYEFILKTDNNNTLCCLQRDDVLQNLILELEEENRNSLHINREKQTLRWWTKRNHAAHLYASSILDGSNLSWKQRDIRTSFVRNLTLSDDGRQLAVPTMSGAGMYFVYALYTFDFTNVAANKQSPIGTHNIYKHRPAIINSERERLWTARFGGKNTAKRQTSFLCGIVNMNMLDTIESELLHGQNRPIWNVDGRFNVGWWRERNHAAHLYAYFNNEGVIWNTHAHRTSFVRNLSLSDDGRQMTVPQIPGAGMYFVYSFFTFDFSNVVGDSDLPVGNHTVYKTSSSIIGGSRDILWTEKVGGKHMSKRQTSFLCGVVNINKMDKIESEAMTYVAGENTTPKHINRALCSNFFGMFKILEFGNR